MKKLILILTILSILAVGCNNKNTPTNPTADNNTGNNTGGNTDGGNTSNPQNSKKPLTTIVPSDDKTVKTGTLLADWNGNINSSLINASVANDNTGAAKEYNLLERLYSTTWYQSEEDYDDGRLETEEEFVFFNENSEMVKREYENGIVDGRDEYATLEWIKDIALNVQDDKKSRNACIVRNTEQDRYETDTEYEGYYLVDRDTLYIVDGDTVEEVRRILEDIIAGNTQIYAEDKFVLSTKTLN